MGKHTHPYRAKREQWLADATAILAVELFKSKGFPLPAEIRVSTGWPLGTRPGKGLHSIGQCWPSHLSGDKHFEVFVSPELSDSHRVLDVLIHELCHVAAGLAAGHGKGFAKVAKGVGLTGKMTATVASEELKPVLKMVVDTIGKYPHATLDGSKGGSDKKKTQGTRMIKVVCPADGYTVRTTRKWIDSLGLPTCPCGEEMEEPDADDSE